jgi:probable non-F420 flavinoid oxidoreductase
MLLLLPVLCRYIIGAGICFVAQPVIINTNSISMLAYHASHEQFAPSRLLRLAQAAEKAGFDAIHSSDHFHPWSVRQGESGFAFSWIAAALQATTLPCSMVCAPGQRMHPAIVAQAIATLGEMFPNRFAVELGSGEALNETITGSPWPPKKDRNERLKECADIIRRLMAGDKVNHTGHVTVKNARLYSRPENAPLLYCAALSEETAGWCGNWADGLLTTAGEMKDVLKKKEAFVKNGGTASNVVVQFSFSFASSEKEAIEGAWHQWRSNLVDPAKLAGLYTPEEFDVITENISRDEVAEKIEVFTDIKDIVEKAKSYLDNGIRMVTLHNVNTNQEEFVDAFSGIKK